ncbi:nicotinate-nucleotide--dimethylbenzimidazole phosphoribosyltransferase [Pseudoalteromonas sp. H105]|uniref:nicotinate-nucleotide--dimethylbenzimidazole phosphoribosyltransferase n=1 Tax=Pseudoalteromonas sp. H105 TaxID=1348393 RepID=UPI00073242F1|nr:nicotinate-nucleotide--dimethylbenzimidazole phosphoribosyltransferase [Pseudoalteromonas sp. H105]KTF15678.1 nicotinate-nucleotide--dimethylbenzimidazole phosphoribosyltransferase [Pseudoalteromonas sp. H105]
MFVINPLNPQFDTLIKNKINQKTKPLGALGLLEPLALQLVKIFSQGIKSSSEFLAFQGQITHPALIVFAGDHGVAAQGVSIAPSEVTAQMVANFVNGGAAINVFCEQLGWQLEVVDCGMLTRVPNKQVHNCRLGDITEPLNQQMAMSTEQVTHGFNNAKQLVLKLKNTGCNTLALGEMGIGNTTSAAAIMAAILGLPATECVGKGTGVSDEVVARKVAVVEQALERHRAYLHEPLKLLAALGGFEIVHIVGAMLSAAEQKMAILVDGFICTAAALVAIKINPHVKAYFIFAHSSNEQGHSKMLAYLGATALLKLELRLGEGTGAALSLPLLQSALGFYNNMASFEDAAVEQVVC